MKKFVTTKTLQTVTTLKTLITQNNHPQALKLSLSLSSPLLTDQIYSLFLKSGHILHPLLSTPLISASFDSCRSLRFLVDTRYPDIVTFNACLTAFARTHDSTSGFRLYRLFLSYGLSPDKFTLSSLLKGCTNFDQVRVVHVGCVKFGFSSSGFVSSGLVQKYGKFGCVESAEKCFEECLEVDSVVWTSMINGYVWNFEFAEAKCVFKEMSGLGLGFNEFSLTAVVGALREEVKEGEQIHGFALKIGLMCGGSLHLSNVIMNMYARCGGGSDARKLFDEIMYPDVVSWTARIGAADGGGEGLEVFKFMHSNGLEVNELTVVNVLSKIEEFELLVGARQVHCLCHKAGYLGVVSVGNALISMYGKCGVMNDARLVFDGLSSRDSISWNTLIGGYSENGSVGCALRVLSQMRGIGVQPDQYTLASVLGAVAGGDFAAVVMQIHSYMIKTGLALDSSMISCLISSYGKCYSFDCAKRVLSADSEIDVGHLQVMAASAITAGCPAGALECFKSAMSSCSELDGDFVSIVLKSCNALTNLGQGKCVHSLAVKSGLAADRFVETAIIDFYCKCGCVSDAQNIFMDLSSCNLAAWNAMIMGYAQHGCYIEVLDLFEKMNELGIKPDQITYLGILQSCCHAGLVNEAKFHLNSMFELHGLVPCLEHYASMVDLLGRVGLVKEAKLIIDQMPVSPDAQVWQSLLSACNNSGDLELGQIAAKELIKLQPENDSAYILLSNLYAKTHDWDAVRRLRREMKEKFIYKEPGSSWIEVGGSVSNFLADDASHPASEKIYFNLLTLAQQMPPVSELEGDCFDCVDVL